MTHLYPSVIHDSMTPNPKLENVTLTGDLERLPLRVPRQVQGEELLREGLLHVVHLPRRVSLQRPRRRPRVPHQRHLQRSQQHRTLLSRFVYFLPLS